MVKKVYPIVDFLKLGFAILILLLHCQQYSGFYPWTNESASIFIRLSCGFVFDLLCRIAVPFFFVTTSFFLFRKIEQAKDERDKKTILKKYIFRMIILYGAWLIINSFWVFYRKFYELRNDYPFWEMLLLFVRDVFLNNGFGASWFVMASIINALIVFFSSKTKFTKILGLLISIVFYSICLMMSWYNFLFKSLPGVQNFLNGINIVFGNFRTSFPAGLLFFYVGFYLAKRWERINNITIGRSTTAFIISFILMFLEVLLIPFLPSFTRVSATAYLSSLLVAPTLFILATRYSESNETKLNKVSAIARKASSIVYFSHTQLILVFQLLYQIVFKTDSATPLFLSMFFVSLILECAIVFLILKLSKKTHFKFVGCLY